MKTIVPQTWVPGTPRGCGDNRVAAVWLGELAEALAGCDEQRVKALVREKLDAGIPAVDVLAECNQGMVRLGNRFANGECYIPELMFGGMIMKSVSAELGAGDISSAMTSS